MLRMKKNENPSLYSFHRPNPSICRPGSSIYARLCPGSKEENMRTHYTNGNALKYAKLCDGCDPHVGEDGLYVHDPECVCSWQDDRYFCVNCGTEFMPDNRYDEHCSGECETQYYEGG